MPDWNAQVRARLPLNGLKPERAVEITEEIAGQLQAAYERAVREGRTSEEAQLIALAQIPDWTALDRDIRQTQAPAPPSPLSMWGGWLQDWRAAFRMVRRYPAFAAGIIVTLTLAIGGCAAIFGILETVVLRPLDYQDPDQLVMIWEHNVVRGNRNNVVAPADLLDWMRRNTVLASVSALIDGRTTLTGLGEAERLDALFATTPLLDVLGVRPLLGRNFSPNAGASGGPSEIIISHAFWREKLSGDPAVIGRSLKLAGNLNTIVGVLPVNFQWPSRPASLLAPLALDPAIDYRKNSGRYLKVIARLRPGQTPESAQSELVAIAKRLEEEYPSFNKGWSVNIVPLHEQFSGSARPALNLVFGAVLMVLLIACANIANLLLARTMVRSREMAVRASLGSDTRRILRQLFTENLVLAICGGLLGCGLAAVCIRVLRLYGPQDLLRLDRAALNSTVLAFAACLTISAALLFGLAPALAAARPQLVEALKAGGRSASTSRFGGRLRRALIATEVALALLLLVGAGLFLQSYSRLMSVNPGFDTRNVLTFGVGLQGNLYQRPEQVMGFYQALLQRISSLPGVVSASHITFLPFTGPGSATNFTVVGRPEPAPGQFPVVDVRTVQPGYFETLKIPLRAGRTFDASDNQIKSPRHYVINEAMVRTLFPNENPLGKSLIVHMDDTIPGEIIGVVGDTRHASLEGDVRPMVYYPHAHMPVGFGRVVIRTDKEPSALIQPAIAALHSIDPNLPASDVGLLANWIERSELRRRFPTQLIAVFAGLAVLLAVIGIYAVVAHSVAERRSEIGLRMALGADPNQVLAWIVRQTLEPAFVGLLAGASAAYLLRRYLNTLLYGIGSTDPFTYGAAAIVLASVCLAAAWWPARAATRTDPTTALRAD